MFSREFKTTWMMRTFGITKVPLIWWCRPKVINHSDERLEVKIPLAYLNIETRYYPGLHHGIAYLMESLYKINDIPFFHVFKENHLVEVNNLVENDGPMAP